MRASLSQIGLLFIAVSSASASEVLPFPSSETLQLMRTAQAVYVFPLKSPATPWRDDKHLRLLGREARHKLLLLLGKPVNWYHGLLTIVEPIDQPTNVGLLFRSGRDELVLFFSSTMYIEAKFRGRSMAGALEDKPRKKMNEWKQHYARLELEGK